MKGCLLLIYPIENYLYNAKTVFRAPKVASIIKSIRPGRFKPAPIDKKYIGFHTLLSFKHWITKS